MRFFDFNYKFFNFYFLFFSNFIIFCEGVLNKKIFAPDIFLKLLKEDKTKIKSDYIDVIKNTINQSGEIKNSVEKNAKLASANICLAEYYKKDKQLSEQYFIKANDHIATMQRSSIYVRQQVYVNLVKYFNDFDDRPILDKVDPDKGRGLIFIIGYLIFHLNLKMLKILSIKNDKHQKFSTEKLGNPIGGYILFLYVLFYMHIVEMENK